MNFQFRNRSRLLASCALGAVALPLALTIAAAQGPAASVKNSSKSVTQAAAQRTELAPTAEQVQFFETQVKPILKANCYSCHGEGANLSGGLQLNSRSSILQGGASGPAVVLAKPSDSLLIKAVNYQDRQMPPSGKLPQAQIDILSKWVRMGLPWTPGDEPKKLPTVTHIIPPQVNAETMKFWSFQPVKHPRIPVVKQPDLARMVKNPIDSFVLSKLEAHSLKPVGEASRVALLRRAYYDVIGLPPTPAEVQAFLADKSPNAYEKVVDRLLASPQYGERWGRHWLDLVRYGETNSFERDDAKPFVWRYRDYVIQSLNSDKPYDQFIKEQLAGDELDHVTPESLIATGYYRLGQWDDEPSDPEQARYDELDDIVATTGQVFLGLTVNCARCHDHKLDPIPQKDYYRLVACFQGVARYGPQSSLRPIAPASERRRFEQEDSVYRKQLDGLAAQITAIENSVKKDFSSVEKEDFRSAQNRVPILKKRVPVLLSEAKLQEYIDFVTQRDKLIKAPPKDLEKALCVNENGRTPAPTFVLLRGNPHVPGDRVEPGFLSILAPPQPDIRQPASDVNSSGRRLALANWIASKDNQLTARVMVNRVWQYHFGRGIVRSSSNFGSLGNRPTHPELLDWLANDLVKNGWKLKPLHKLIMMSSTYRRSAQSDTKDLAKDPENDLFWRFDMRRLDAEEIRDSILAVNGSLNTKMGGPSIFPAIPKEVLAGQSRPGYGWTVSTPEEQARRSVYIHIKRSLTVPILASFDAADTDSTCPVRFATTQPTQALGMMNSAFIQNQAKIFAEFAAKTAGPELSAEVKLILRRVLQREPTVTEINRGLKFIKSVQQESAGSKSMDKMEVDKMEVDKMEVDKMKALKLFCVVALNLDEFIYLD